MSSAGVTPPTRDGPTLKLQATAPSNLPPSGADLAFVKRMDREVPGFRSYVVNNAGVYRLTAQSPYNEFIGTRDILLPFGRR